MARNGVAASLLIGVFAFVLVQKSEGLNCWVCSSDVDPACGDPFNHTNHFLKTDCDSGRSHTTYLKSPAVCRKYKHKSNRGDEEIVVRSCAWGSEQDAEGPCSPAALHFVQHLESCSVCTTDECNGSSAVQAFSLLVALPAALLVARLL